MNEHSSHSIRSQAARIQSGEQSVHSLLDSFLERIETHNPRIHALTHLDQEDARKQALQIEETIQSGQALQNKPLLGIPIAIKDNIAQQGHPLSCASNMLKNFVSPYDATVIAALKEAGALLVGRANLDEFAMGSSTETSSLGLTRNPWNEAFIPGGSSGGSAAAVSAGLCAAALGSDTGGSIRQPASFCGCVGLKPSYGRVSRYGLTAFASSLDQIGPLTRSVEDAAVMLETIAGYDPKDSTSVQAPVGHYSSALGKDIKGLRIGLPKEYFVDGLAKETRSAVDQAIQQFENLGAEIQEVSLPHTEFAIATYYVICTAEASANLARFDGIRYGHREEGKDPAELYANTRGSGFGAEVKRRIILGTYVLSSGYYDAYYLRAQKVRTLIRKDFEQAFKHVDLLLTPTVPSTAFKIGEKAADPLQMYLTDIFTISANLVGNCGISLPCGFSSDPKLPIGLQLMGKPFEEETLLQAAHAYEQATSWHHEMPV